MAKAKEVWPPLDRPIIGQDVKEFLKRHRLDINLMESLFAIPSRKAWYELTADKAGKAERPVSIPMAILLRLFSAYPDLIPFYDHDSAEDLRENLNLSPAAFGMLTGRQEISVRQWSPEREPHKVVMRLLWLIRKAMSFMRGHRVEYDGAEMLADIVRFGFLEWTLRGETPSQRRNDWAASNLALFREVLSIVPHRALERAASGVTLQDNTPLVDPAPTPAPRRTRVSKKAKDEVPEHVALPIDMRVTPDDRHRATRGVRDVRTAQRSLEEMSQVFKI